MNKLVKYMRYDYIPPDSRRILRSMPFQFDLDNPVDHNLLKFLMNPDEYNRFAKENELLDSRPSAVAVMYYLKNHATEGERKSLAAVIKHMPTYSKMNEQFAARTRARTSDTKIPAHVYLKSFIEFASEEQKRIKEPLLVNSDG